MELTKCFCVIYFLPLLVDCLYAGDACTADRQQGRCKQLSECQPLLDEIQSASHPMPLHLRVKLQKLSCGFNYDEPIICCVIPKDNEEPGVHFHHWLPDSSMGMSTSPFHDDTDIISGSSGQVDPPSKTDEFYSFATSDDTNSGKNPINSETTVNPGFNAIDGAGDARITNDNLSSSPADISRHPNLGLLPENCGTIESDRIFGGNRTKLYEMPWMVLLSYESGRGSQLSCGGTLINEQYVLTAAHCVTFLGNRLRLVGVVLGEYDVRGDPDCERVEGQLLCAPNIRNVTIEETVAHPGYNPQTLHDDIALLRLSERTDFNLDNMKPICLPTTPALQRESMVGKQGVVAGWGATEDGLQSSVLLSVNLPIISNSDCQNTYKGNPRIYDRQLCAGGVKDKDSCGGDSGGPLLYPGQKGGVRYIQRGIVSFGSKRCGIGGFPGVYTRVAYYMDWILDNIRN